MKHEDNFDAIFMLAKRNYKVYANIGVIARSIRRLATVFDTGSGSSFLRLGELQYRMWKNGVNVRNASGTTFSVIGSIYLVFSIVTYT